MGDPAYANCEVREFARYLDGTPRQIRLLTYDHRGAILVEERDAYGDGRIEVRNTWQYDQNDGRLIAQTIDARADGRIDMIETYVYDDRRWLIRIETDGADGRVADGRIDRMYKLAYDRFGDDVRHELDRDADGVPERIAIRVFNPPGRLVGVRDDLDADGQIDKSLVIEWKDARIVRRIHDRGVDGIVDYLEEYFYGAAGRLARSTSRSGPELIYIYAIDYAYNHQGWLASEDHYRDGVWHDRMTYRYTRAGRLSRMEYTSIAYRPYVIDFTSTCGPRSEDALARSLLSGLSPGLSLWEISDSGVISWSRAESLGGFVTLRALPRCGGPSRRCPGTTTDSQKGPATGR